LITNKLETEQSESLLLFRHLYDTFLEELLNKSGQLYQNYQIPDFELAIHEIIKDEGLECKISVNEAIYKAKLNIPVLDSFIEVPKIY
ncbi:MAG: hypothetical protein Q8P34_01015, partial [Bacteroidota bacterium]|nr:hypothetical protein [Bacteroidota bacterium]